MWEKYLGRQQNLFCRQCTTCMILCKGHSSAVYLTQAWSSQAKTVHLLFHSLYAWLGLPWKQTAWQRHYFGSALAEMLLVPQFKIVPKKKKKRLAHHLNMDCQLLISLSSSISVALQRKKWILTAVMGYYHHYPLPPLPLPCQKKPKKEWGWLFLLIKCYWCSFSNVLSTRYS